jgi:hypothetical protein
MRREGNRQLLALAILGVVGQAAWSQNRVETGNVLDANNRIGSGGINAPVNRPVPGALGNAIVTGNVTGGRQFRGPVPYTDPGAFRGNISGVQMDSFIRGSSGVPLGVQNLNNNAQAVQSFFGASRGVAPPTGYVQQGFSGGFVPSAVSGPQPNDLRLNVPIDYSVSPMLARPGQLVLPGPVDPTGGKSSVLTASPLYGVRQWDPSSPTHSDSLTDLFADRPRGLDAEVLRQMRSELVPKGAAETTSTPGQPQPVDASVANAALPNEPLVGPEQQSTQYADLKSRLEQFRIKGPADQAPRGPRPDFLPPEQASPRPSERPTEPSAPDPAPGLNDPGAPRDPAAPPAGVGSPLSPDAGAPKADPVGPSRTFGPGDLNRPRPVLIKSLATGIQAQGLAELMTAAETALKEGKFTQAIDLYDSAEQVAPNNPLILLGRAHAELGASYYARAEQHLRQAFTADQALLMAQYDLREQLGDERLQFLVNDLKEIASRDKREARAVFLLAYIDYNTGNERLAAARLAMAEQRTGGSDPLVKLLRDHWALPALPPQDDEGNK